MFQNKTLLISGGTGSFGTEMVNHILGSGIKEIRIFSRDEKKQEDMRIRYNNAKLKFYIGDVRDFNSVCSAMQGVDFVFHAAALKQVPSCEFFPIEAVKTNILGTENILDAAIECDVKKVVVLSTDKAVYPINAMGMSKAMMEKVMVAKSRGFEKKGIILCGTRYGNVIGSRGSVAPLFIKQIKSNKNITITDPAMTRFLMSLKSAITLVLYAFEHANPGDIFVQKAPASTIADLAHALLSIFKAKNKIQIIGTRHGEKLYETLLNKEEMLRAENLKDYYRIPADTRDLNYSAYYDTGEKKLSKYHEYNSNNTSMLSVREIMDMFLKEEFVLSELHHGKKS